MDLLERATSISRCWSQLNQLGEQPPRPKAAPALTFIGAVARASDELFQRRHLAPAKCFGYPAGLQLPPKKGTGLPCVLCHSGQLRADAQAPPRAAGWVTESSPSLPLPVMGVPMLNSYTATYTKAQFSRLPLELNPTPPHQS